VAYYHQNLKLLSQRQPTLAQKLESSSFLPETEIVKTRNNLYTLKKQTPEGKFLFLHSQYDPQKEAQRIIEQQEIFKYANIAILGFGFGYQVKAIYEKIKNSCDFILIIEEDISLFKTALKYIDFSDILLKDNIYFSVGENPMIVFRFLQAQSISLTANGLVVIRHAPSLKITPSYYQQIQAKLKDVMIWSKVNIISQVKTTNTYYHNIFENIPLLLKTPGIKNLFAKFKKVPAIIVAAGPSLNKNIDYLKKVSEDFLIIAVDTALRVLSAHQISPHIVVSIDFTPDNLRYFKDINTGGAFLVVDPEVYPEIFRSYQGPKFIINLNNKSLCSWLVSMGIDKGSLDKGLSVAHTAFLLAKTFGCDPVIFIGQDLAYTAGISHSRDSIMSRKINPEKLEEGFTFVDDIFDKKIPTSTSMFVFLKHFEDVLYNLPFKCIDATEGGAKIKGTDCLCLREVIYTHRKPPNINIRKILQEAAKETQQIDFDNFKTTIDHLIEELSRLQKNCSQGIALMKKFIARLSLPSINISALKQLSIEWKKITKDIYADKAIMVILRDNITDALVLQAKRAYQINEINIADFKEKREEIKTALAKDQTFYERLNSSGKFVMSELKRLKEKIE